MTTPQHPTRKLFASMMVSLDGFIEGPDRELDWHLTGPAFDAYCDEMLDSVDLLVFGRVSYQGMVEYWPAAEVDPTATPEARAFARKMNQIPKVVLSTTLARATWNARVIKDHVAEEIGALKRLPGKSIAAFGGAAAIATLLEHGLVDELRLVVNPIVLGRGRPLFPSMARRIPLVLTRSTTLDTGALINYYRLPPA